MITQEDFQSGNHIDKSCQRKIEKKREPQEKYFQGLSFIGSLYEVVDVLSYCIIFFT